MVRRGFPWVQWLFGLALGWMFCAPAWSAGVPAIWDDPSLPLGIVMPDGVSYLFGRWTPSAATADGAGGAFMNGVQGLVMDGQAVDVGVSALASESGIVAAAAGLAPTLVAAAAVAAGLDLASQGLSILNGQWVEAATSFGPGYSGTYPQAYCSTGALAEVAPNSNPFGATDLGGIVAGYTANNWTVGSVSASGNSWSIGYGNYDGYGPDSLGETGVFSSCADGSSLVPGVTLTMPSSPATPAQVQSGISGALTASPSDAPIFANNLAKDGASIPVTMQTPTGPASVTGSPTTTTTVAPSSSGTGNTTTTKTCTPTVALTYSPGQVSGTSKETCTTTVQSPSGTSSSATTTSTPPTASQAASQATGLSLPGASVPQVAPVPPSVIQVPVPTIDNSSGTCPAPLVLNLGLPDLQTMDLDLTPWCTLAENLRPWVLTLAGIVAAVIVVR